MERSVIEAIAAWSCDHDAFSPQARERARHALSDTIACMLAGATDAPTLAVRAAFADEIGAGGAAGLVGGGRAAAAVAALVNGVAAHTLDYDDNFRPAISHASAVLVPALLAVAEAQGTSGRRLIDAYLVGLEAQAAVGRGVNGSHYLVGWHATSTVGCIGTAAGVAWLMGLDRAGIARALSVAVSMAAGVKGQFGTPAKPLHAGLAARNAVDAARLAAAGMTGRLDILEGAQGFKELYGGPQPGGWESVVGQIGTPHVIENVGLAPKRHPCCGSTHNTLDMILDLKRAHGFTAGDVAAVETWVGLANARNLAYPAPQDEMQARFSMQYCVAVALLQERLGLADFTPAAVQRPAVRALLPLTTMHAYPAGPEGAPERRQPHRLRVALRDGRVLEASREFEKGTLNDPFDDADRWLKFRDCCEPALGADATGRLYAQLAAVDEAGDVHALATALAAAPADGAAVCG